MTDIQPRFAGCLGTWITYRVASQHSVLVNENTNSLLFSPSSTLYILWWLLTHLLILPIWVNSSNTCLKEWTLRNNTLWILFCLSGIWCVFGHPKKYLKTKYIPALWNVYVHWGIFVRMLSSQSIFLNGGRLIMFTGLPVFIFWFQFS